ncbi:MAG: AraC family transcriptional regulator [Prevotellaceae bacterium]|jgi:AraC-like DNA-binding protein|nr:AraC family transcriptional regulator [Prevotellaceae bacterium]
MKDTMKIRDGFTGSRQIALTPAMKSRMREHPLGRDLYITEMGYYPHAGHHFCDRKAGCGEYIFIYCVDGQGWVCVDGARARVGKNQYFVVPLGIPHSYGAADSQPWTIYWIHFGGERARALVLPLTGALRSIEVSETSRIEDRLKLFEEMYTTLDRCLTLDNMLYASLCLYHVRGTLVCLKQFREANASERSPTDEIAPIIHYMRENIEKNIAVAELVRMSGYSVVQFHKLFIDYAGMSPKRYYLQLKIREACRYLSLTTMKVNQLCNKIGFADPLYFTRVFSKAMGCSPRQYRQQQQSS